MEVFMDNENNKKELSSEQVSGLVNSEMNNSASQTQYDKYRAAQGHGYAAEQANNLYDLITGHDAKIVDSDNAKNGADRYVNGVNIQTKYCSNASLSVAAAFDNGKYRYINPDGSPMQLEVPSDQYDKAVELVEKRIANGEVPGITDPADAKDIVRKGHFTYSQAVNIAKFGTIESISYDAVNGAIIATSAFGITAVLTLARSLWNGNDFETAIEYAAYSGIQIGGASFITSVITSQLMRTAVADVVMIPSEKIVALLGKTSSQRLANALISGSNIYGSTAMNNAAKLLRGNLLSTAVMTIVLSMNDISNAFKGRISGKQLFKNMTIRAGAMTGAAVGAQIGLYALTLIAPAAGGAVSIAVSIAGSVIGGSAGAKITNTVIGNFIEDDAVKMVSILEKEFCKLAYEYMLTEEEIDIVLSDISSSLENGVLLDMFASNDRKQYANSFLRNLIERLIRGRCRIILPAESDFIMAIGRVIENAYSGTGIFSPKKSVDPVAIGKQLTGQILPKEVAQKAWYATKQMNMTQMQGEMLLRKIAADEKNTRNKLNDIYQEREKMKQELKLLLGGNLT